MLFQNFHASSSFRKELLQHRASVTKHFQFIYYDKHISHKSHVICTILLSYFRIRFARWLRMFNTNCAKMIHDTK